MLRRTLLMATLSIPLLTGCGSNDVPAGAMAALQGAEEYELLSLDPSRVRELPADHFHGWRVLGRTTVKDQATRKKLNDALRAGAKENSNMVAACFNPRHGIHVVHKGKVYDVVICFECLQAKVFEADQSGGSFLVSSSPQAVFDGALQAAGVALPEKEK